MPIIGIYQLLCETTQARYVGQSRDCKQRMCRHRQELRKNKHSNVKLQNAWNKYGSESFSYSVLEESSLDELNSKEQIYLDNLDWDVDLNLHRLVGEMPQWKYSSKEEWIEAVKAGQARGYASTSTPVSKEEKVRRFRETLQRNGHRRQLGDKFYAASARRKEENRKDPESASSTKTIQLLHIETNEIHTIHHINAFCEENGLNNKSLGKLRRGEDATYRGWALLEGEREKVLIERGDLARLERVRKYQKIQNKETIYPPLITPNGNEILITGTLIAFAAKYNLDYPALSDLLTGRARTHKGWSLKKEDYQQTKYAGKINDNISDKGRKINESVRARKEKGYPDLLSPDNQLFLGSEISNMSEFCRTHNIDRSGMTNMLMGRSSHCKGWRVAN